MRDRRRPTPPIVASPQRSPLATSAGRTPLESGPARRPSRSLAPLKIRDEDEPLALRAAAARVETRWARRARRYG